MLSQEESEDYYDIRLSYRPTEGFRGESGHEQFTIDKTGPIRLRHILSQPQPSSRRVADIIGLAVVLVVIGATIGGLFAAGRLAVPRLCLVFSIIFSSSACTSMYNYGRTWN